MRLTDGQFNPAKEFVKAQQRDGFRNTARAVRTFKDDRTDEQTESHRWVVMGVDRCMSGWGDAEGTISYAGWACTDEHLETVKAWVKGRSDMERVRILDSREGSEVWPQGRVHIHIYAVDDGHPALTIV
jgi:hypothetical protein